MVCSLQFSSYQVIVVFTKTGSQQTNIVFKGLHGSSLVIKIL